jgi:hypothetical protein
MPSQLSSGRAGNGMILIVFVEIAHKLAGVAINNHSRSSNSVRARFVLSRLPWAGISRKI